MNMRLILAEKPSVGKDLGRVLNCNKAGNGFLEGKENIVTWALGHLVTLADPETYNSKYANWELEDLPIIPKTMKTKVIKQTRKQFNTVKELMLRNDVNEIVIATDAGREGELVARWIIEKAGVKKPIKRLWISSVTDKAIREGFSKLKDGRLYEGLYASALARAQADWIVGINATRALTTKYNAQLSCGRVQTPTLAMIKALENEIQARHLPYTDEELKILKTFNLITAKPVLYVANVDEDYFLDPSANKYVEVVREYASKDNSELMVICGKIEEELSQLEEDEKREFLAEMGFEESGLDRLIRASYRLLGLISFFTTGPMESRAWTIVKGTKAPQAAGKIHSDMERGFIRAEVTKYEDVVKCGSMLAAREKGLMRLEGKDYVMEDGDIVLFRFNV
jgi:hypothetical protein